MKKSTCIIFGALCAVSLFASACTMTETANDDSELIGGGPPAEMGE